jgi:CO/xanthine dehydrogenase Mo-binding subunit
MTEALEKPAAKPAALKIVGTRPIRPDGIDKVTGRAAYGADFAVPGMLYGAILRSPHAHARIISIDTRKAQTLPGVKAIITGKDFPKLENAVIKVGEQPLNVGDVAQNCMATNKALYAGHAVAAVAATSPATAAEALALINVTYEVLPHVIDVEEAMRPDAPLLHETLFTAGLEETPDRPSNISVRFPMIRGDVDAAFAEADVVVGGRYTTQPVHQGYIEPHACVVSAGADGQAQIWCSSQGAFMVRTLVAAITAMSLSDLRVFPLEIGGGFGGKTTIYLEPVALLLSRKSGRPVKLVMNRGDVFRATGPAAGSVINIRLAANKNGLLTGAELDIKHQAGAFPGSNIHAAVVTALAAYNVPNFKVVGWDIVSNFSNCFAYRAPGAPPAQYAVESALDEIARKLKIDPIDLRLKNGVKDGDLHPFGMPFRGINFLETLEAAKGHPHYTAPLGPHQGRGVGAGFWLNFGGESTAMVNVSEDGSVVVATGNPDIGGSRASMAMMAAEVLGLPLEKVRPIVADTASIGYSMLTGGSRTTFATGKAVVAAALECVEDMKKRAAMSWGIGPELVAWENGQAVCTDAARKKAPMPITEIAEKAGFTGGPISAEVSINPHDSVPTFGVHICDVEVDPETGHVRVLRYTAVQDVGRAIHPGYVEGQMQGGAAQGIGWALSEAILFDSEGRVDNPGFLDFRMAVASDLPMIDTLMVEIPNPNHPFGVKGVGEVPIVPPLGTVANAVRAALGKRLYDLPLTPDRVYAALQSGN